MSVQEANQASPWKRLRRALYGGITVVALAFAGALAAPAPSAEALTTPVTPTPTTPVTPTPTPTTPVHYKKVTFSGQAQSRGDARPGDTLTYQVRVNNPNSTPLTLTKYQVQLPSNFSFVSAELDGLATAQPENNGAGLITWNQNLKVAQGNYLFATLTLKATGKGSGTATHSGTVAEVKTVRTNGPRLRVLVPAIPKPPVAHNITECGRNGSVDYPNVAGLIYSFTPILPREGKWEAKASALDGYYIPDGQVSTFSGDLGKFSYCQPTIRVTNPDITKVFNVGDPLDLQGNINLRDSNAKTNIAILIDYSDSMKEGAKWDVVTEAVDTIDKYLASLPGAAQNIRVALADQTDGRFYNMDGKGGIWTAPGAPATDGKNKSLLLQARNNAGTGLDSFPGKGIVNAIKQMRNLEGQNFIFLLTDGGAQYPDSSILDQVAASGVNVRGFSIEDNYCAMGQPLWSYTYATRDRCVWVQDSKQLSGGLITQVNSHIKNAQMLYAGKTYPLELDAFMNFKLPAGSTVRVASSGQQQFTVRVNMESGDHVDAIERFLASSPSTPGFYPPRPE